MQHKKINNNSSPLYTQVTASGNFPTQRKGKTLFCSTPNWGVAFAEGSTAFPCFSRQSWGRGHQLSCPCRVLAAVCSLIHLWAGPAGSHRRHHILPQMLLRKAHSAGWSAAHSQDSTPDTFKSLFRFSSFISTQQGCDSANEFSLKISH